MLTLFLGVFGGFALVMLCIWALLKVLDEQKVEAQQANLDPPLLRSHAVVDLTPSGQWQHLPDEAIEAGAQRFDALLLHLRENGFDAGRRITEDWGEFARVGPFEISFSSLDDGTGWMLFVGKSGRRPLNDSPPARQLLSAVHDALRVMNGVTTVRWYKKERLPRQGDTEAAEHPVAPAQPPAERPS